MKATFSVRLSKKLKERVIKICKKEGGRSINSFMEEAAEKLVTQKENGER